MNKGGLRSMVDPCQRTLAALSTAIRSRRLSSIDLAETLLERIQALEPMIRAWTTIDPEKVLQEARERDREIRQGKWRGPLHGIPIGVKDLYFTAGMRTTVGSKRFADFVPTEDATAVKRLRDAGAIILGKTATTEFAFADPAPTCNPWNLDHTPGGSSSGSAAAVAARMCPAALGSQTGGSILRPAAYCGIVGLKPTYGRISRFGVFPFAWTLDHPGPLTRTVEDAAMLLTVLSGHDPKDPSSSRAESPDFRRAMRRRPSSPKIGIVRAFYREQSDPSVWRHFEGVLRRLRRGGLRIEEAAMPRIFSEVVSAHRIIMQVEGASVHREGFAEDPESYGPRIRELIEAGLSIPAVDYLRAQRIRRQFCLEMEGVLKEWDSLIMPTTPTSAPGDRTTTGDPSFQAIWSFAGLPSLTLPSGLDGNGLPLGIQLVGPAWGEGKLLSLAHGCERILRFSLAPPIPHACSG